VALVNTCEVIVCAWGNEAGRPWVAAQADRVYGALVGVAGVDPRRLVCLGTTTDGSPRHPLMVPYAQALESYRRIGKAAAVRK